MGREKQYSVELLRIVGISRKCTNNVVVRLFLNLGQNTSYLDDETSSFVTILTSSTSERKKMLSYCMSSYSSLK